MVSTDLFVGPVQHVVGDDLREGRHTEEMMPGAGTTRIAPLTLRDFVRCMSPVLAVRPEGANHQWRKIPPGELSIDPVADERLGRATARVGAS